ncbi:hypothetical protein Q8F55_006598 [Vanrija albida]|uniref:SGNH hydrolase-type esterase domain-containing protein n=1 Tax=Vanrija albida TaxID=181172 RepID=A0ABR3PYG7_9TREE
MLDRRRTLLRLGVALYAAAVTVMLLRHDGGADLWLPVARSAGGLALAPPSPPPPPPQCSICTAGPVGARMCSEYGPDAMARLVSYAGTNHRLRRALARMRSGRPFSIATIGGSVSMGHGLKYDEPKAYAPVNMHGRLFAWLNDTFPAPGGSVFDPPGRVPDANVWVNGAQPARGADYFSMCSQLHVPEDPDLVVVELGINDPPHTITAVNFELLIRQLLEAESQPGVLVFNAFALKFDMMAMGAELNHGVAQFYDVPTLTVRNALAPLMAHDKKPIVEWFTHDVPAPNPETLEGVDIRHFSDKGHEISADMMIAYLELQLCEMDRAEAATPGWTVDELYPSAPLFPNLLMAKWDPEHPAPPIKPTCIATNSDKYPLAPARQTGWRAWQWKDKKYLVADEPGSTIEFEFSATRGTAILYFLRSFEFGLGTLACEIDGVPGSRKKIPGHWTEPFNIGRSERWDGLQPGKYVLKCELLKETADPKGGTEFRLMALMTI